MIMKNSRADFFIKLAAITLAAFVVFNFGTVGGFFGNVFKILQPVLIGIVLALAMSVPLRFFERRVFRKVEKPRLKEFLCLTMTFLIFGGVVAFLAVLIVPQGIKSVKDLMERFSSGDISAAVSSIGGMDFLQTFFEKIYSFISARISEYLPKIMSVMQTVFTGLYNVLFGAVIAIMLVINRKNVKTQLKKAIGLIFKERNIKVHAFLINASEKFSRYLGGQLTEAVRRRPYSVVLFDEIEKAHPDVFNILLQVLDDGRITDSQGRTVDFKNTIIIMTSKLGSVYLLDGIEENGEISATAKEETQNLLKQSFRPEFLNRLDEIVFFKPLTKTDIIRIVDLLVANLRKRLSERQLNLHLTDRAKDAIAENSYDPQYGARPLKRYIQSNIDTLLARTIIEGNLQANDTISVDYDNGKFVATNKH